MSEHKKICNFGIGTYPLVAVVLIDVFDWDVSEFRWEDGSHSDGQWHALLQGRIGFATFVFVFVIVSSLSVCVHRLKNDQHFDQLSIKRTCVAREPGGCD